MPLLNGSCTNRTVTQQSDFEVAIELYLISIIGVLGLVGNIISVIVLWHDKDRRQTLLLLQILALSDGLYLVAALVRYPLKYMIQDLLYQHIQLYGYPLLKMFQTITIWMMVLVAVDRFIHVCKPLHVHMLRQRTRKILAALVFVFGTLYSMPRFFEKCLLTVELCDNKTRAVLMPNVMFHSVYYYTVYRYAMHLLFLYLGPLITLCVVNIKLIITIRKSRQLHQEMHEMRVPSYQRNTSSYCANQPCHNTTNQTYNSQTEDNATLVLAIIILVFIICETPESITRIIIGLNIHIESIKAITPAFYGLNTLSALFMVINCSINFFIYVLFGKRFRQIINETFIVKLRIQSSDRERIPLQQHNI